MIFLDSSFIIACKIEDDENHKIATSYLSEFIENEEDVAISDYIFNEFVTVLLIKTKDLNLAINAGEVLKDSTQILDINTNTFEKSFEIFKNQKETRLSFTDCSTIALMKREKIKKIATFDKDFKKVDDIEIITRR